MTQEPMLPVLALVPYGMQEAMRCLQEAAGSSLSACVSTDELSEKSLEDTFAVALVPAGALPPEEWWSLWGLVTSMEPRPSILVYAEKSDFSMWAGALDAGAFDLLVAPFTVEKLREAILSAAADFAQRSEV
jgi:FixJ family two-component response regulator